MASPLQAQSLHEILAFAGLASQRERFHQAPQVEHQVEQGGSHPFALGARPQASSGRFFPCSESLCGASVCNLVGCCRIFPRAGSFTVLGLRHEVPRRAAHLPVDVLLAVCGLAASQGDVRLGAPLLLVRPYSLRRSGATHNYLSLARESAQDDEADKATCLGPLVHARALEFRNIFADHLTHFVALPLQPETVLPGWGTWKDPRV